MGMSVGRGIALAFLIVIGAAITFPFMLSAAAPQTRNSHSVTNETFHPSAGTPQQLSQSNITNADYDDSITVYDENETPLAASGNYTWYEGNGTIKATVGGRLDGDSIAYVTYGWVGQTKRQQAAERVLVDSTVLAELLPIGAMLLLAVLGLLYLQGASA